MDILYYGGHGDKNIKAINLDNVKNIECKDINSDIKRYSYIDNEGLGLYMDGALIHHFFEKEIMTMYYEILKSDDKIKEIYDLYCERFISDDYYRQLIIDNGFMAFKNYLKSRRLTPNDIFYSFKFDGVKRYLKLIESNRWLPNNKNVIYELLSITLTNYYVGYLSCQV